MKVTAIDSAVLRVPTAKPMSVAFPEHRLVSAVIHTDEGLTGLGYTLVFGGGAPRPSRCTSRRGLSRS